MLRVKIVPVKTLTPKASISRSRILRAVVLPGFTEPDVMGYRDQVNVLSLERSPESQPGLSARRRHNHVGKTFVYKPLHDFNAPWRVVRSGLFEETQPV